ncbi:hypothetical protein J4526_04255 [Desulfurococcaceae archaeon MEX13E-LK6-19]|nr:hypothetical protein J4526_04255 [Desulfurococcaceae archaeon MEX13E-LK6-19]
MDRRNLGIILIFIGVLLIALSYTLIAREEPQTFEYSEEHTIPPERYYRSCLPLVEGDNITIVVNTNNSIGLAFTPADTVYDVLAKKSYSNISAPQGVYSTVINTTQDYCLLLINNGDNDVSVSYTMNITRLTFVEPIPYVSITGLVLVGIGIAVLYSIPLSKAKEYSDIITGDNIVCRTKSLNKHECVITLPSINEESLERIVEHMTSNLGYREKKRLGDTIVFLEKKGSILPTNNYSRKRRSVIVSIEPGILRLNYIISMASASGPMDLEGIYNEVKTLEKLFIENL